MLNNIQKVLNNVKDLEKVAASLYYVVNSFPLGIYCLFILQTIVFIVNNNFFVNVSGADQLAAAKICHAQAQEWVKLENSENAKSGIKKVCGLVYSSKIK